MPPYNAAGAAATAPMVSLAEQAYNSLCYDFPVVDTAALAALASSYKTNLSGNGRLQFPITSRFVSGLQYLVETHFEQKKSAAVQNDVDSRSNQLVTLCGCVFFKAPVRGLAAAPRDDGATLNRLLASFQTLQETTERDDFQSPEEVCSESVPESDRLDLGNEQMADELDDDDTEWEPIETHSSSAVEPPSRSPATVSMQELSVPEWPELITKLTALGSVAPFEVTSIGAAWDDLQLTEELINALKVLRQLENSKSVDVMPLARLYAGVMCDRVTEGGTSSSTRGQELGRLVTAIIGMAASTGDSRVLKSSNSRDWACLALRVLATLSCKLKGSGHHERALWPAVSSNLPFLEQQLTRLFVGASLRVPTEELEMVFQSLCFWLKHAPGNASVGPSLMQTGILRTALQLFLKIGAEPQMEALREFLLFAMARSKQVAQYLIEVPTFVTAISDSRFLKEDTLTRAHGLVWPLLLRAGNRHYKPANNLECLSQAEAMLDLEVNHAAETADGQELISKTAVLTRLVRVLQQLEAACSASSEKLWLRGSSLDKGLTRCYTSLSALSATIRNLEAQDSEGTENVENVEEDQQQERRTEKIAELLSRVLPMLKKLTAITKGDGNSKAD